MSYYNELIQTLRGTSKFETADDPFVRVRMLHDHWSLSNNGQMKLLKAGNVYDLPNTQAAGLFNRELCESVLKHQIIEDL